MIKKLKNKWNLLYLLLAALIAFSVFGVPPIAKCVLDGTKNQMITIGRQEPRVQKLQFAYDLMNT